jgi:diguanylate cyclase (GGDEF)-like protein
MLDIDRFKSINDEMGHLVGDYTLRELSACLRKMIRREDLFARYGGEEFALILVETNRKQALEVAERIRQVVEKHVFSFEEQSFSLTVSLGVVECPSDGSASVTELIRLADENLYEAKRTGRNKVVG